MAIVQKTLSIEVSDRRKDGGRIVISTGRPDRDRDRVFPQGARLENYLRNPVVQWGHNYMDPWATIGRSRSVEVNEAGIVADFELREPATDHDPMHIVRYLWDEDFVRTASIGFRPETAVVNDLGGLDFTSWELLEWSLVPIPANADALRLAAKSFPQAFAEFKRGRVLSAKNESRIRTAYDALGEVLGEIGDEDDDGKASSLLTLKQAIDTLTARVEGLKVQPPVTPDPAPLDWSKALTAARSISAAITRKE